MLFAALQAEAGGGRREMTVAMLEVGGADTRRCARAPQPSAPIEHARTHAPLYRVQVYNEEVRDLLAAPGSPARPLDVSALAAGALPPGARPHPCRLCGSRC